MATPSLFYRAVDALSKKTPQLVKKHPVALAGVAGVGLGLNHAYDTAPQLEGSIMRQYVGNPNDKYGSLEKFAERKEYLDVKTAFVKVADGDDDIKPFGQLVRAGAGKGLGGGLIDEGIGGIRRLLGVTAQSIHEKMNRDPQRNRVLSSVMQNDPDISSFEQNQPGSTARAYQTMVRYAPELSTDPNIVTAFLRHAAMSGGPIDHVMVKGLAEAEMAVQKAQNEGAWLKGGF